MNRLIVLSWSNSVIKVKIPPGLAPGLYKVGVYCNDLSVGGSYSSGWKDFKIRKAPSKANDIDVSDIWLDDKCRLWVKHTNRGTTRLNIVLRERIWVNGRMIDDSTETIVLAPGRWISHGVLADPGYIVSGGVEVKAQIDVDNVLAESNERNNILKKRVRCKKPSLANDIDVSDIWLDDKCRLWVKHTNRGTTRLNIVLRERIWVNGRMIDDS
ncbi:MAG: hypothetical protein GY940_16985, partial [bacterium]|nr:hypothetical protein [bacterium]